MRGLGFRSAVCSFALGLLAVGVVACASKQHGKPVDATIIPKLAGKWTGSYVGTSGSPTPADLTIDANGNYKMSIILTDISTTGKISAVDGQLVFNRTGRTGPSSDLNIASGTFDYQEGPGGSMQLSGFGRDDRGPFSGSFTKVK
ncbi:MAG: hypothetical protein ACREKS_07575 [Candidatus Rokuibacteriota bacterium]